MIEYNEHTMHSIDSFFESNFDLRLLESDKYMIINFMNSLIKRDKQQENDCKYCQ